VYLVIGNPEGLEGTVSDGIISAFRFGRSMIQITAPISHGSSGSPVLDESGNIIGMAILVFKEGQNLNFAIAVEKLSVALTQQLPREGSFRPPELRSGLAQTPSVPSAAPPTRDYSHTKWPDEWLLIHPEHFLKVHVINVQSEGSACIAKWTRNDMGPRHRDTVRRHRHHRI
jgi:hypothetical protein